LICQYEKDAWLAGCEKTNFMVGPLYSFLTYMKNGINMVYQT